MGARTHEQRYMERVQHRTGGIIMTTPKNPTPDIETRRVPNDQLEAYFDRFTKHFLLR